jgi:F0F1-type ATP synthase assembly protein I
MLAGFAMGLIVGLALGLVAGVVVFVILSGQVARSGYPRADSVPGHPV